LLVAEAAFKALKSLVNYFFMRFKVRFIRKRLPLITLEAFKFSRRSRHLSSFINFVEISFFLGDLNAEVFIMLA